MVDYDKGKKKQCKKSLRVTGICESEYFNFKVNSLHGIPSPAKLFTDVKLYQDPKITSQGQLHDTADATQSTADLTAFVQNLLQQMQSRFQTMSDSIITKIDEMGNRIDDLEKSIGDLIKEVGVEPGTPQQPNNGPADSSKSTITNA